MAYGIAIYGGASTYYEGNNVVFKSIGNSSQDINITPGKFVDITQTSFIGISDYFYISGSDLSDPIGQGFLRVDEYNVSDYSSFLPNSNKNFAYLSKYQINKYLRDRIDSMNGGNARNCRSSIGLTDIPISATGITTEVVINSGKIRLVSNKTTTSYVPNNTNQSSVLIVEHNGGHFILSKKDIKHSSKNYCYNVLSSFLDWYSGSLHFTLRSDISKVVKIDKPLNEIITKLNEVSNRNVQNLKDSNEFITIPIGVYRTRSLGLYLLSYAFGNVDIGDVKIPATITHRG
ncbi:MAG: hypothetical protein ACTTIS_00820 [Streptobacillus sp.]